MPGPHANHMGLYIPLLFLFAGILPCVAEAGGAAASSTNTTEDAAINYCLNISDKAAEQRIARQTGALKAMEVKLEAKIRELDQHRATLQEWVEKQNQLRDIANARLIEVYGSMDPEAAAEQMANLDLRLASSVLAQLKPRIASGIMNEMQPELAARLVKLLAAPAARESP